MDGSIDICTFILTVISLVSIFGGVIAICGLIWTNLSRLEKTFALLKLTGLNKKQIMLMVIFENLIYSLCNCFRLICNC